MTWSRASHQWSFGFQAMQGRQQGVGHVLHRRLEPVPRKRHRLPGGGFPDGSGQPVQSGWQLERITGRNRRPSGSTPPTTWRAEPGHVELRGSLGSGPAPGAENGRIVHLRYERFQQGLGSRVFRMRRQGCPIRATRVSSASRVWKPTGCGLRPAPGWPGMSTATDAPRSAGRMAAAMRCWRGFERGLEQCGAVGEPDRSHECADGRAVVHHTGRGPAPSENGRGRAVQHRGGLPDESHRYGHAGHRYLERQLPAAVRPELDGVGPVTWAHIPRTSGPRT